MHTSRKPQYNWYQSYVVIICNQIQIRTISYNVYYRCYIADTHHFVPGILQMLYNRYAPYRTRYIADVILQIRTILYQVYYRRYIADTYHIVPGILRMLYCRYAPYCTRYVTDVILQIRTILYQVYYICYIAHKLKLWCNTVFDCGYKVQDFRATFEHILC